MDIASRYKTTAKRITTKLFVYTSLYFIYKSLIVEDMTARCFVDHLHTLLHLRRREEGEVSVKQPENE
jgi:hypothetical protein